MKVGERLAVNESASVSHDFLYASDSDGTAISLLKKQKKGIIRRHARPSDVRGFAQVMTTLASLVVVWWVALWSVDVSIFLTAAAVLLISLLTVRAFALMHECGHRSLFRTQGLNFTFGFLLGVVSGMPQYVWSQHHNYHHATNGNWGKYRGLYTTLSVDEYAAMTDTQQRIYEGKCSIVLAPFAGLIYVIINPRLNWLKGSLDFVGHFIRHKIAKPDASIEMIAASFEPRYWRTSREYWHMFWNNLVLLSGWGLMCSGFGTMRFFSLYLTSASLAAGVGVILFTVQHNFEHSYASEGRNWNYDKGAIEGTSFLVLPRWLNWFTANIAYHHIHHISAKIPNYRLVGCHKENEDLFAGVRRVRLSEIPGALRYILWDRKMRRIISVAEYQQMIAQTGLAR